MVIGKNRPFSKRPVGVSVDNQFTTRQAVRVAKYHTIKPHRQKEAKQQTGYAQPMYVEQTEH
ncbi:hypothetical protein GCM10028810_29960 [Spirosoma litoris]